MVPLILSLLSRFCDNILETSYFEYFKNVWSCLSIMIVSLCRKLWCPKCWNQLVENFVYLHVKKSTPSLSSFFLRYCKDIGNLLFWELWECLTIPIKIIVSICRKLSRLSACKKINFITHFSLKILERNSKLVILGISGMIISIWRNLWCLGKKLTLSFTFSLRYGNDITNLLFWVLLTCLTTHTQSGTINL